MEKSKISLRDDGIVVIDHGFMANVTQKVLTDVIDQLMAIDIDRAPLFIKSSGQILVSNEVLAYHDPELSKKITAIGILTSSHSARAYAKRYQSLFENSNYPINTFNKESLALAWLNQYSIESSET